MGQAIYACPRCGKKWGIRWSDENALADGATYPLGCPREGCPGQIHADVPENHEVFLVD
jgi:hypothetical protein